MPSFVQGAHPKTSNIPPTLLPTNALRSRFQGSLSKIAFPQSLIRNAEAPKPGTADKGKLISEGECLGLECGFHREWRGFQRERRMILDSNGSKEPLPTPAMG